MARAQVRSGHESLDDRDFNLWLERQAALLGDGRLDELDVANLREEIEDMGRSEKRALEGNLVVLLVYLLKYRHQPDQRTGSWRGSIVEHRRRVNKSMGDSPGLRSYAVQIFAECYRDACEQAAAESGLALEAFPAEPSFTIEQALATGFLPE